MVRVRVRVTRSYGMLIVSSCSESKSLVWLKSRRHGMNPSGRPAYRSQVMSAHKNAAHPMPDR